MCDILVAEDICNKKMQPGSTSYEDLDRNLHILKGALDDLALRKDSAEAGNKPCKFVEILLAFAQNKHRKGASVPKDATYLEKMCAKMTVRKVRKNGVTLEQAVMDIPYKHGENSTTYQMTMEVSPALLKEAAILLRAYGHHILRVKDLRFANVEVVGLLFQVFRVAVDYRKADTPKPQRVLRRLAEIYKQHFEEFMSAWEYLHLLKESMLQHEVDRASVGMKALWGKVLRHLRQNDEDRVKAKPCVRPLQLLVMLVPNNAGVEKDGNHKRILKEVMQGNGSPSTVDARMRVCLAGPDVRKTEMCTNPTLVSIVREFWLRSDRRINSNGPKQGPGCLTDAHKEKLRLAKLKPSVDPLAEDPVGVKLAEVASEDIDLEVLSEEELGTGCVEVFQDLDGIFDEDVSGRSSGLPSVMPPPKKKRRKAEEADAVDAPSLDAVEEAEDSELSGGEESSAASSKS